MTKIISHPIPPTPNVSLRNNMINTTTNKYLSGLTGKCKQVYQLGRNFASYFQLLFEK
jgi:hypothetical protein